MLVGDFLLEGAVEDVSPQTDFMPLVLPVVPEAPESDFRVMEKTRRIVFIAVAARMATRARKNQELSNLVT